jgi:hypothetical protein
MMTVVRLSKSLRSADITMCSVVESSDDVAEKRINIKNRVEVGGITDLHHKKELVHFSEWHER